MRGRGFEPPDPLRDRISQVPVELVSILSPAHLTRLCYPRIEQRAWLLEKGFAVFKKLSISVIFIYAFLIKQLKRGV